MPLYGPPPATLSAFNPCGVGQFNAVSTTSINPASWAFQKVELPAAVAMNNVILFKSFNVGVPAATSQNSSGTYVYSYSQGMSLFTRQDYSSSSSNISCIATASYGLTFRLTHSSDSQSIDLRWVTDSTGGSTSISTTSGAANWSNSITGGKIHAIPFVTTLTYGEYWFAFKHSSTVASTATSAVTPLSVSNYRQVGTQITGGYFTSAGSVPSIGPHGGGLASAVTTNATMASSVITNLNSNDWFALSNVTAI